jgi:hypothetical protein
LLAAIIYYENQETESGLRSRSDGATLMEACRTDFFEPNGFTATRMYEAEGISPSIYDYDYPLNHSNVLSEWTKGYGIINMIGHADNMIVLRSVWDHDDGDNIAEPTELEYIRFLRYADSAQLNVEKPPIVYSLGCHQLSYSKNMGRVFLEAGAAVAFIGSTDISWYNISMVWNDERDGGGFSMNYYFFHYLINYNQKCGNALYNSKVYYYNNFMFTENNPQWIVRFYGNLFGFNLYGDPSLGLTMDKGDSSPPKISVEKPTEHLYLFDREIIPTLFGNTIVIGRITINVSSEDDESDISEIEFYVDDRLKSTVQEKPYTWLWDEITFGKHTLKVVAHDNAGNMAGEEIVVWKFF